MADRPMHPKTEALLRDVDIFLYTHGIAAARFGVMALNDSSFVLRLRRGRRIWPETEDKVRYFMLTYNRDKRSKVAA